MRPIRFLKPQHKGKVEEFVKEIRGRLHTSDQIHKTNVVKVCSKYSVYLYE